MILKKNFYKGHVDITTSEECGNIHEKPESIWDVLNYFGWYTNSCEKLNEEEYLDKWVKECDGSDPDHGKIKSIFAINYCNSKNLCNCNSN